MKSVRKLIVPLIILVIAVAAYFIATGIARKADRSEETVPQTGITVFSGDGAEIKTVSFKSEKYDVAIEKSEERYYLASDRGFPLNQTTAGYFFSAASEITGSGSIDGKGRLAEYGLEEPQATVTVGTSDGTIVISVGDYNKYSGSYYCRLNDGDMVYLLSSDFLGSFEYTLDDLFVHEKIEKPSNGISDVVRITVESDGGILEYRYVPGIEAETDEDGNEITAAVDARFDLYNPDGQLAGEATETGEKIYDAVFGSSLTDWVDYNVTEEEKLEKYGLKSPFRTVTVYYTATVDVTADDNSSTVTKVVEKSVSMLIGDRVQKEEPLPEQTEEPSDTTESEEPFEYDRYVKLADGRIVYVLAESGLEGILNGN